MGKFRIVHSAVHAAIAAVCWLVLSHFKEVEATITRTELFSSSYAGFTGPAVVFALALLFRLSDRLSNAIVESVPGLSWTLRRLISGRDFIEGDWPLVVVDMERQALLYLGFLNISFKDGHLYVSGDDWRPDGAREHEFQSVQSLYRNQMLQYWYEQGASLHKPDMRGYTEIYFFPKNAYAVRHAGKFLDPKHTSDIRFYAKRLDYRLFERRCRTRDAQLAAARKVWQDIEPNLSALKLRAISADFE